MSELINDDVPDISIAATALVNAISIGLTHDKLIPIARELCNLRDVLAWNQQRRAHGHVGPNDDCDICGLHIRHKIHAFPPKPTQGGIENGYEIQKGPRRIRTPS